MSLPAILSASAALENLNLVALGINHAYDEPPEALMDLPVAVRFAEPTPTMDASDLMGRYNIFNFKIEVHLARGVLLESYANALPVIRAYQNLYAANLSIGSTCDVSGFREPACEGPVRLRYGTDAVETIGIVFYMWAKEILDDITVELADGLVEYMKGLLLETGQITQYGGYPDDGFYELGLDKQYTVLTLGRYAGTTPIVLNAKTENHSNNCVEDLKTGKMWARYVSGPNVGPANNGLLPWTTNGAGEGIYPYVAAANAAGLANYTDWRGPNIEELESLRNMEAPRADPDGVAFPTWPAGNADVWSTTTRPDGVTDAMLVRFIRGTVRYVVKTYATYCALVRG